ncbi:MAG: hypothetical protein ABFD00_07405 [Chloroherpetonaceae bacterium]|nr:hypothetical protein [bacterium]
MKTHLILFICIIFTYQTYSQQDSALVIFKHQQDKEMRMLYDLLNIQYIGITCPDTNLRGKLFFVSVDEYNKGKIIQHDDLGFKEGIDTIPLVTGSGDTMFYMIDYSSRLKFDSTDKEFTINLMGKYENDTFALQINLPAIWVNTQLTCTNKFLLRAVNPCGSTDSIYIPLNKTIPIVAFTPPFDMGRGGSYCLLATKDVKDWYKEFKVEHYYVFNLLIK